MSARIARLVLVLGLAGCSRDEAPERSEHTTPLANAPPPTPPFLSSIGERCLDCHADVVRSYRETGMARALGPVREGELAGLAAVDDGATGWSYRFEEGERGARIVERWKSGAKGIDAELAFAIGAGLMDRSYAARVGDLLWFAPLEVLGHGEHAHAAMAPGLRIRPGLRFTVPIAEECLACHTDVLPPREYPLNLRPDPKSWQPTGITCAACHGDVEGHATWREAELAGGAPEGKDPVLTTRRAGWVESLSVCARCHLQGDASFLLEPGARGIPPPGGDLLEKRAVFVAANPSDEIGFVSQVERLVLSRCFTGSIENGRDPPTCLTCHDPHRSSFEGAERQRARDGCLRCHTSNEMPCTLPVERRAGSDCVQCHMRETGVFDVDEVEIHDHAIRRRSGPPSPREKLRVKESTDGKMTLFAWPGRPSLSHSEDPGLWMMAMMAYGRPDLALPYAEKSPGPSAVRLPTYHHLRGSLLEKTSHGEEARAAYERALALDPAQAESAVNLGLLLAALQRPREGLSQLDAVIQAHPRASGALRNRALVRHQLGDGFGFVKDLEYAFEISPDAALARVLAEQYRKRALTKEADRWERAAREVDPSR